MPHEPEKITRKLRIDKQLQSAGWIVIPYSLGMDLSVLIQLAVEELPTDNGPADYALFVNGVLLGVMEGEKVAVGAQNVLQQAKRYSKGAFHTVGDWNGYRIPFLYSTNGELIYHLDVRNAANLSRQVFGFNTPEALVDRKSLAAQAVIAFASFDTPRKIKFKDEYEILSQRFQREDFEGESYNPATLPNAYLTDPDAGKTFLYVCTIQRMVINLFGRTGAFGYESEVDSEDDAVSMLVPSHAFDLIIADECHRDYTSKETNVWRGVLNHFDSIKVGLSASAEYLC